MNNPTTKKSNLKNLTLALAISAGTLFSVNASAAQTVSLEEAISQFVINQGQQMIAELNTQITQSITVEVDKIANKFISNNEMLAEAESDTANAQDSNIQVNNINQVEE